MSERKQVFLCIDPGLKGGFTVGQKNRPIQRMDCVRMPVIKNKGKSVIWIEELADLIRLEWNIAIEMDWALTAVIEKVHAMPKQGVTSTFTFGEGYGAIKGILAALAIPFIEVRPQEWQKVLGGIDKSLGKKRSIVYCSQKHPHIGKLTDGQADALAMLDYMIERCSGGGDIRGVYENPEQNLARPKKRATQNQLQDSF